MKRALLLNTLICSILIATPASAEMFGSDYKPCGEQPNTLAIVGCIDAKTEVWDQRLNSSYRDLMHRIDAGQSEPLRAAQRLWVRYRDANCAFYGAQDGTIREIQAAECLRVMTKQRAIELGVAMKFD